MSKYRIILDGKTYEMEIECIDDKKQAMQKSAEEKSEIQHSQQIDKRTFNRASDKTVRSPMPGTIVKILLGTGSNVKKGQPVLILEAMKMENEITAPTDGRIASMYVKIGDAVQSGAELFEVGE